MNIPENTHADWLLTSQECLIKKVSPSLSTEIITDSDNHYLYITQIPTDQLFKLEFITNTDQNNNYLYIKTIKMYLNGSSTPLEVIGIEDTMKKMYDYTDINSFINNGIKHIPWADENFESFNFRPDVRYDIEGFIHIQCRNLPKILGISLVDASFSFDIVLSTSPEKYLNF